jgi:hypothetical protein
LDTIASGCSGLQKVHSAECKCPVPLVLGLQMAWLLLTFLECCNSASRLTCACAADESAPHAKKKPRKAPAKRLLHAVQPENGAPVSYPIPVDLERLKPVFANGEPHGRKSKGAHKNSAVCVPGLPAACRPLDSIAWDAAAVAGMVADVPHERVQMSRDMMRVRCLCLAH